MGEEIDKNKRALISACDKSGIVDVAHKLIASGYQIISI